jgi:uncharacterized membrane protein YccC
MHMPKWWRLRVPADTGFVIRTLLAFVIAMYVAYQLELESPYSAGTTVIIVAANARGAVLSKSLWRIVGSVAGVVASIVLIACFVQAPVLFVFMIALWLGVCTFISSLLRYFRSYGAVLAGYTVTLVALPAVSDPDRIFDLAITRLSVVVIGVLATGLVFLITDQGTRPHQLQRQAAALFADTAALVRDAIGGTHVATLTESRSRIASGLLALDQAVEFTAVEDAVFGNRATEPRIAIASLLAVLTGADRICGLLRTSSDGRVVVARAKVQELMESMASPAGGVQEFVSRAAEIAVVRGQIIEGVMACRDIEVLSVLNQVLDLLEQFQVAADRFAILQGGPSAGPKFHLRIYANPVTALRNGARAALAVSIAGLFWILSQWPSGGTMLALLGPLCGLLAQSDSAAAASGAFLKGIAMSTVAAFFLTFAVLPQIVGFPLLMAAMLPFVTLGLFRSLRPGSVGLTWTAFLIYFVTQTAPDNPMRFDLSAALNTYSAFLLGGVCSWLSFRVLLPPNPRAEAMVLMRSVRNGVAFAARGRLPPPLTWEHLQHQKLIRLSRRLAGDPAALVAALQSSVAAVLVGRGVLRLRSLLVDQEVRSAAGPLTEDALFALRGLHTDPVGVAKTVGQVAAGLAEGEDVTPSVRRIAAVLYEVAALLSAHSEFFISCGAAREAA